MIAVDACVVISYLSGEPSSRTELFDSLLAGDLAALAPSTVTELLSDPRGGPDIATVIAKMKGLDILDGYWSRSGLLCATIRRAGRKAALGDALLAQACIDAKLPLLTSDRDFTAFVELSALKLA